MTAILILILMGVSNAWGATQSYVAGEYIYIKNFVPSGWGSTTWILSNSYAWAHMWGGTAGEHDYLFELYSGTAGDSGAIYRAKVTTGGTYTNVIFTRNSSNKGPWGDKWNQTGNIVLDGSSNCFTAFTADNTTKTCSEYAADPTAATLTLAGAISGDGSQANPYNVYEGVDYMLTASGTFPDPGNTKQYAFNNTTYSTTNTKTVSFALGTTSYYANVRAAEGTTYSTAKKVTIYLNVIQPTYSYTVAAGVGGSVTPTSGTVAQGSGVTIEAIPNDGYEFDKWTATNGTLANANSASTTFTPSANNAKATASFKLAGCTQTPTTPTSLTAKVGGNALAGEVCSGASVTLTAGGTISVGSLQWGTGTVGENIIAEGNGRSSITVSPAATTTYWVRSIITDAGVCYGVTSDAKTLQVSITPALVQPVLSKSTLTLEEGGSTSTITLTSGTTGGTWTSSDTNVATVNNGTVTPVGPGTATITYTVSNACEADKTATCTVTVNAKPYYIAGRLQQKWDPNSKAQQFTYVSNGQYKYETGKTVAELSVGWSADNNYLQYFFIHTGTGLSSSFTSSNNNGHNFHQKLGYANALTLSSNSEDKEAKYIKFANTNDNSSDVVIWWEPSTNKLWYTAQKNYKITYGVGTNNGTDAVTTNPNITSGASVLASTEITFRKGATKAGYAWKNWNSKADGNGTNLGTGDTYVSSNRTGDISVYACYDLITYNITYYLNGGSGASNTTYNVESATITLPTTPTKTGYTFAGWSDFSGNKVTQITKGSTGNKEFWANWTINSYTVTWKPNGGNWDGNVGNKEETYNYGVTITSPAQPTRLGYTFAGWSPEVASTMPDRNLTYTAQWVANSNTSYVVKHYKQNLDGSYPQEATETETFTGTTGAEVTPAVKSYEGFTAPATQTCTIAATGNLIVTYEYTRNSYQLTWNLDGGTIATAGTETGSVKYEAPLTAPTVEKTGYTFAGWNSEVASTMPAAATTYTAQWTANKYTVTFDSNGATGGSMSEQGFTYGSEQTLTKNGFTYGDYVFLGWSKEAKGTVEYTDQQSVSNLTTENNGKVVLYAIWATPKTIYLKTVEGTEDGFKWYVKYNSTEVMMTPLGCTGEYYQGEVPEETEFQLIAKDQNGDVIAKETRDGLVIPNDDKNLFNLVAAGASGDKIFFKPNTHWLNHKTHKYFVARFWTGSAVIKDLVDPDGDGIYECEKPAGVTEVHFFLTKAQASTSNWNDWPSDKEAQTNDNVKEGFKDGKNLFTLGDDQEVGGNNDTGTWSEFADTPVNGEGAWEVFEGITYRITFEQTGATDGETTNGTEYVDAQYRAAMPTIESLPKNTNWKFGGYYTAADGGTAITNAFGDWLDADGYISDGKWAKEACVTLYAHWVEKTPEITVVTLDKEAFDAGTAETVTATPTVQEYPSYTGKYTICWKLLNNSGTVMELFPFTPGDNKSVTFSTDGLTTGKYTVRASIYASACGEGEELSRYDKTFTIVSGYKVTVKYLCDGEVIQASYIAEGHASTPTPITAPEIGGYKFVSWELGDGIFSESDLKSENIEYTAIYDGYLTAKYEKRKLIFLDLSTLKTKANWTVPHIYLYKGAKDDKDGGYWNDQTGAGGAKGGNYITHAAMTPVPNTENIWYFDYEEYTNNFNVFVAFTSNDQKNATHFANCEAIYRTEFSSGTPVFVPESDQTAETKNSTAKYYSKGYWVKYMGGTGYWLIIYNAEGNKELVRREFTSATQRMTMTSIVDLEADHTYQYEIYRNDGYYYKGGDITYSTKDYTPLDKANKGSIHTTETGDYTFTLDYFDGDLQIKVQHPGEVGNYRILYTDDVRNGRYKPSQIISKNNKEPLVSFFIRPNDNPVLKVQSAARVTGEGVTWATTENEIFFKPNANWKSDGARFAAYFYNASNNKWVDMKANGDLYSCAKPTDKAYTHVIFCRMDPKIATNNFQKGDGKPLWNQTRDLTLPTDKKNFYTLEEGAWRGQIYLKPNSNWTTDGARFAAYFFQDGKENIWHSMMVADADTYWCDVPEGYTNVIFCRMNPNTADNNWNEGFWGMQTNNLTIPTNTNDLYTITDGQNNPTGSWSCKSWSTINGSITDLSDQLEEKLRELDLTNIKENEGTVFNIHLSNNSGTPTIEKVALYTGNYYIRVDAVDGKWYDYKTNPDNLMTYSAFSESDANSFGEKFSHYKTKWCEQGMNVKFVIANDYSLCISDTLTQDEGNPFGNIDEHGNINSDGKYNANIRFMWNRHTNKVSRAYVAAASDDARKFLVLKANKTIHNESGNAINNNEVVFNDTQNWIYERTIKVQPGTRVKLYACYPGTDEETAQHFRGVYDTKAYAEWDNTNSAQILGGSGEDWYTMRIVYDFKTNRLMGAWVPDQNINDPLEINADIMVIRQHQEDATCITFANGGSLTEVKTVYGVIRFNRWTLNNRSTSDHTVLPVQSQKSIYERALYFISFPFDVHLSDVFGFGTYGTHWVISEYNGLRRAERGYFADNCVNEDCTNWDYIWEPDNFVLEANKGYLLSLDLDLMKHDNEAFWAHNIQQVELFFPSYANVEIIAQTSYTMPALDEKYKCTIDYSHIEGKTDSDRRVKDSYWRCIGVPSFADYNSTLTTDGETAITWKPKDTEFPFLYEWNVSDNSLMVRAANKYRFRPTFAYLVQNGNEIHWSAVNATPPPASIAARQRTEAERNYDWKITLSNNDVAEDQTFLRMTDNEEVTKDFDFNQDLAKELNYGRSDIYTLIGYEKAAANSMPFSENTTVVPLGLDIEQAGDYTIAMPEGVESVGVTLLDAETGERINLSIGMDYTISLNKGACHNRLYLEISPIQQTTTDIEYTDQGTREQSVRKVLIDGKLIIRTAEGVFDAQGKRL